jgi:hypothetical protein
MLMAHSDHPAQPKPEAKSAQEREDQLDLELDGTFPASDPLALTQPSVKPGAPERKGEDTRRGEKHRRRFS